MLKQTIRGASSPSGSRKNRFSLSTFALLLGILLVLAGTAAYVAHYPWKQHLYRWGWAEVPADLADPAALPVQQLPLQTGSLESGGWGLENLLDPAGQPAERPAMSMTWLGVIKLPQIDVSENIVEGTGDEMLYAVGHVPGSAPVGGEGNCVLAAHRNYVHRNPFRHLDKLREGDKVLLQDGATHYTYEVTEIFEVGPSEQWVMEARTEQPHMLTLLTCTPVSNPTRRLVVRCSLTGAQSRPHDK